MKSTLLSLMFVAIFPLYSCSIPEAAHVSFSRPGDANIGVLIPVHSWSSGPPCSGQLSRWGQELVALLLFTIDGINKREDLLGNVTLGFDIRDNCYSRTISIWSSLALASTVQTPQFDVEFKKIAPVGRGKIIGVLGTESSSTSILAAQAANIYELPVISPFATSNELSNEGIFPYFLRTVPADNLQALAIADILLHFDWKYVGLYYQLNSYGIHGAQSLQDISSRREICIAFSVALREHATETELMDAIGKISDFPKARVVVLFMATNLATVILKAVRQLPQSRSITYVGSDSWAYPSNLISGGIDLAWLQGSIFVQLTYNHIPGFREYYQHLQIEGGQLGPWFKDFKESWMHTQNCQNLTECIIPVGANDDVFVDGVYVFVHALHDLLRSYCGVEADIECVQSTIQTIDGNTFLPFLKNVTFEGISGPFSFDSDGNPAGRYKILSLQVKDGSFDLLKIGEWRNGNRLDINTVGLRWIDGSNTNPLSVCIDYCQSGFIKIPLEKACCFGCKKCPNNAYVYEASCVECSVYSWPNADYTNCEQIVPTPPNMSDPLVIAILVSSTIGLALSVLAAIGLFYHRKHALVKAASRELSAINLTGLAMAFLVPVPLLLPPTFTSCRALEAMVAICATLTYTPTLLKVNRIFRIFEAGKRSNKPPRYTGPRSQIFIVVTAVLIVSIIFIIGAYVSPTVPAKLFFSPPTNYIEAFCEFGVGFLVSTMYNLVLILVCCYYAFRARRVPSNFNESKFIGVSVYSTLVFGVAAVPVYVTAPAVLQKLTTFCVAILLNSVLTLFCLYLPKLYAIHLDKDVQLCEWRANSSIKNASAVSARSSAGADSQIKPVPTNTD